MYKRRSFSVIFAGMMVLSLVIVLALVYAGFTGELNINGMSVQRSSTWDIYFENLSSITTTGSAKVLSQPSLDGPTTIEDYSVSTTSPGDSISFTFKVVNDGNYNASISSLSIGTPTCTGTDSTSNTNVCGKLSYTLTYENGASVQANDILYAKDYQIMKVTLTYAEFNDPSLLPTADVSISGLGITINYEQSGSALVNDNGTVANYKVYHQGDKITLNNEDYWLISNSGAGQDYVVALKDKPLTVAELNLYGGVGTENNHVNRYTSSSQGTATNYSGYGYMAYYSSATCKSSDISGCTTNYSNSDVKFVLDAWADDVFTNGELKEVDGLNARLITKNEYQSIPTTYTWRYKPMNGLTMSQWGTDKSIVWFIDGSGNISGGIFVYDYRGAVRPVINVYKSAIDTNNNE